MTCPEQNGDNHKRKCFANRDATDERMGFIFGRDVEGVGGRGEKERELNDFIY